MKDFIDGNKIPIVKLPNGKICRFCEDVLRFNILNFNNSLAIRYLDEWSNDDSGYDEGYWPELKKYLDEL